MSEIIKHTEHDLPAVTNCRNQASCPQMRHFRSCPSLRRYIARMLDKWAESQGFSPESSPVLSLSGIQANLNTETTVAETTFIPTPSVITNNSENMTIEPSVGQITVNVAGTYQIGWLVQSDSDASVALTINGNLSTPAPSGMSLLTLNAGDIVGLMNLGTTYIAVTFAQLTVIA